MVKNMHSSQGVVPPSVAILLMACCVADRAYAQEESDEWQYTLTPYLWLPTIDGALNYSPPPSGGGNTTISVGPADWLELLNFGLLINGSAKKGRFTLLSDLVFLSLASEDDRVASVEDTISLPGMPQPTPVSASLNLQTKTDLDGLLWMVSAGYTIEDTGNSTMDLIAGVRYLGVDISTRWDLTVDVTSNGGAVLLPAQGSIGQDVDLWDGIVGIRGEFDWSAEKWSVPYYLDIGTGSSDLTWQAMAGLSYAFGWGELMVMYRHLEYDEDTKGLIQDFSLSGPAFGARFRF